MNLGVITMKQYSTLLRALELESRHLIQVGIISRTPLYFSEGTLPLSRGYNLRILRPGGKWLSTFRNWYRSLCLVTTGLVQNYFIYLISSEFHPYFGRFSFYSQRMIVKKSLFTIDLVSFLSLEMSTFDVKYRRVYERKIKDDKATLVFRSVGFIFFCFLLIVLLLDFFWGGSF